MMVFPCGTAVVINIMTEAPGHITGISIRFGYVQYEVTYYVQGVQQKVLVDESEIIVSGKKIKIGYK